ncbi:MAG: hypothetical protein QNJ29_14920 [Rhizobiaceae bacterium]|nr:hypothetical protein [Rhizobiaceae bacterium]
MKKIIVSVLASVGLFAGVQSSLSADLLNPTPVAQQQPAVDGINFELSILGGSIQRNVLGSASNAMFTASVATPIPYFSENFGAQVDLGAGIYDGDFTSAAGALHLFWRDPSRGAIGIYGDWGYVDPEHAGRVGAEVSIYDGQWSLDVFAGMQFGQHVFTEFVDEVDLSYYATDNTRVSIGHRLTSRGHVGNFSFEHLIDNGSMEGWSIFGEIEGGEDDYVGGFGGLRYAFGSGASTLIDRDRQSSLPVRIPRNLVSVSQCGRLDTPRPATSLRSVMTTLCASEDEINGLSTDGISKIQ